MANKMRLLRGLQLGNGLFEIVSGAGVPSGAEGLKTSRGLYLRSDGTADTTVYVTVNTGSNWSALDAGAVASISDGTGTLSLAAGALSETGITTISLTPSSTVDIDAGGAVSIDSSGGAISVGGDAVAQAVNIATGAAARVITIGNNASASIALNGGVGAATLKNSTASLVLTGGALSETAMTDADLSGTGNGIFQFGTSARFGDDVGYLAFNGSGALAVTAVTAVTSPANNTWDFGTGQADFGGNLDANAGLDVSGAALTISGFDMAAGGRKITGLGAATVAGDAVRYEQMSDQINGSIAVADLVFSGQPVAAETVTIGANIYEWNGVGANINVVIGGSAEASLDNLVTAINGSGTELVRADKIGTTVLRLQSAATAGGTATNADPSIALSEASTNVQWECGNVNMNSLSGRASSLQQSARATLAATTALVGGADAVLFQFDFTPAGFIVSVRSSAGAPNYVTDQFTVVGNAILWTSAGATHVANGDIVSIYAWE